MLFYRFLPFLLLLTACGSSHPPKRIRLPPALTEASGLVITGERFHWHNDSGDGPYLYTTDATGQLLDTTTLAARAIDYEDLTKDPAGNYYVGDFGNNGGLRTNAVIYRYQPSSGRTDSIVFHFPGQNGAGRDVAGNYDCEALAYQGGYLHLFTKDQLSGRGNFLTYHFRVPAQPGTYVAELRDSLRLPRRVVTAAAIDSVRGELVFTAYNFRMLAGFLPSSGASLITLRDYPPGQFLQGRIRRRNLSCLVPTQFEAIDFYDARWLYVASEGTRLRKHALARRKRRR